MPSNRWVDNLQTKTVFAVFRCIYLDVVVHMHAQTVSGVLYLEVCQRDEMRDFIHKHYQAHVIEFSFLFFFFFLCSLLLLLNQWILSKNSWRNAMTENQLRIYCTYERSRVMCAHNSCECIFDVQYTHFTVYKRDLSIFRAANVMPACFLTF